jgi:hypothetical protein
MKNDFSFCKICNLGWQSDMSEYCPGCMYNHSHKNDYTNALAQLGRIENKMDQILAALNSKDNK